VQAVDDEHMCMRTPGLVQMRVVGRKIGVIVWQDLGVGRRPEDKRPRQRHGTQGGKDDGGGRQPERGP
jgi:hypothetical protein